MKICKVKLYKFRGVGECILDINEVNALVGENNAGKSSLLRALNAFFNFDEEEIAFIKGKHQYTSSSLPTITIFFDDLPDDEEVTEKAIDGKLIIEQKYSPRSKNITYKYITGQAHSLDKSFIDTILKKYVDFVLIPPIRNERDFIVSEQAVMKRVIDTYLEKHFSSRDTVTPKFKTATNFLQRNAFSKIAKELGQFYNLDHGFEFQLTYNDDITYKDFLQLLQLKIVDREHSFDIEDNGSGIQSLTIIALYRLLASLSSKNIILGIEEPEVNLHPQAQKQLIKNMISSLNPTNEIQIFFTTHSTVIVDTVKHTDIILFRKIEDSRRGFKTIVTQLPSDFMEKYGLEEGGYNKFHKYRNSEFFFSRFIVLVESTTDAEMFIKLMELKHISLEDYSLSVLNLDGVDNMKYPLFLIKELNLPFLAILDKDYFLRYLNEDLNSSRDTIGFPRYRYDNYKSGRYIESLITDELDRTRLLELFRTNHSRALDLLEKYNIICMKYCLEMDLIASDTACNLFYDRLQIDQTHREKRTLLVDRSNAIKKMKNLAAIIESTPHKNLPNSYKRIKKVIAEKIKEYC